MKTADRRGQPSVSPEQLIATAEEAGNRDIAGLALAGSARVALNQDPAASVRLLREAIELTRDLPDSLGRSSAEQVSAGLPRLLTLVRGRT